MKNPNAVAALAASQAALAAEQLLSKYLTASVGAFWEQEIMAAATVAVLYVGRHGIKAALGNAVETAKRVWAPPKPNPAPAVVDQPTP